MALSEEEQKLLAQLEASLAAEDPKLAQTLGSRNTPRQIHGRRATLAGLVFLLGLVLLVAGMQTVWVLSVLGFVLMFTATIVALGSWRKVTDAQTATRPQAKPSSEPFMGRMEDRWRRRQEGDL
ncbi:hypothetical protein GCM10009785_19010 [Brooklawnia cerclae]|uniref:Protein-S-isoprenylcysteine O-methyltransferase Ste14 n=1 Tax=Brooklawnia cerclae TaxID=349934 RepID=A0ABX0SHU0_9ACTN|nr:DUF3040 domain-containing protein [Brooklawnia cerclae]NIH57526.1 protein-S-isoprenylcysteine O-methyltransferase Ste14 [Brooklawnia cerclae]